MDDVADDIELFWMCSSILVTSPTWLSFKEIKTNRALLKLADIPVSDSAARFHIARSTLYRALKSAA